MSGLIQLRRDVAANWTFIDPTLALGELGAEIDTNKIKIGDGSTAWTSLVYLIDTIPSFRAGEDIASATAIDLTEATGNTLVITGTTESTSLVMTSGQQITLLPSGAWPMTFDVTTMNINGGADYTCSPGDRILAVKDLAGVIRVTVIKQDGTAVVAAAAGVRYPQNSQSADYTLVIGDAGKSIFHPDSDTDNRTFTIPANASVAFDVGTIILFVNEYGAGNLSVAINSDTIEDSSGNTGTVVLAGGNVLTALKITSTKWMVWGENGIAIADPLYFVAVAHTTSPFISAYPWSASGFGTKFSNPSTLPTGTGLGVAFSPSGTEMALAHGTSPFVSAYTWSASGFGTKFANPGTLPQTLGYDVAFSPAGTEIAVADWGGAFVSAYPWSASGFGTKFANPATPPTGLSYGVGFSPPGTEIVVGHDVSPFVSAYPWSTSGFGTKFANPTTLPTGIGFGVAFTALENET